MELVPYNPIRTKYCIKCGSYFRSSYSLCNICTENSYIIGEKCPVCQIYVNKDKFNHSQNMCKKCTEQKLRCPVCQNYVKKDKFNYSDNACYNCIEQKLECNECQNILFRTEYSEIMLLSSVKPKNDPWIVHCKPDVTCNSCMNHKNMYKKHVIDIIDSVVIFPMELLHIIFEYTGEKMSRKVNDLLVPKKKCGLLCIGDIICERVRSVYKQYYSVNTKLKKGKCAVKLYHDPPEIYMDDVRKARVTITYDTIIGHPGFLSILSRKFDENVGEFIIGSSSSDDNSIICVLLTWE